MSKFTIVVETEKELPDIQTLKDNLQEKIEEIIVDGLFWMLEDDDPLRRQEVKVTIE